MDNLQLRIKLPHRVILFYVYNNHELEKKTEDEIYGKK